MGSAGDELRLLDFTSLQISAMDTLLKLKSSGEDCTSVREAERERERESKRHKEGESERGFTFAMPTSIDHCCVLRRSAPHYRRADKSEKTVTARGRRRKISACAAPSLFAVVKRQASKSAYLALATTTHARTGPVFRAFAAVQATRPVVKN